jgi:hypothetical protein
VTTQGIASLVGIFGEAEGRMLLDMNRETARCLASLMNRQEMDEEEELVPATVNELANIIAGRTIVPELIQNEATPERIAAEVREIIVQRQKAREMKAALAQIQEKLGTPGASDRAARLACGMLGNRAD